MQAIDQSAFEADVDVLLKEVLPCSLSNQKRKEITEFIAHAICSNADNVFGIGSSALGTYLPESDIDLVVVAENIGDDVSQYLGTIFLALFAKVSKSELNSREMVIRNIEFVNARTNVIHCIVNNVKVDITLNQIGGFASVLFLEEADLLIGCKSLFKRSLVLIKCWCMHESSKYCGQVIAGSKSGMLSSYALNVMVLYLFNKYTSNFYHPFSVLRVFLFVFAQFDWDNTALTLSGPCPIALLSTKDCFKKSFGFINRFEGISQRVGRVVAKCRDHDKTERFVVRACNIVDPVDSSNNLGISVPKNNLNLIQMAFQKASTELEALLPLHPIFMQTHMPQQMYYPTNGTHPLILQTSSMAPPPPPQVLLPPNIPVSPVEGYSFHVHGGHHVSQPPHPLPLPQQHAPSFSNSQKHLVAAPAVTPPTQSVPQSVPPLNVPKSSSSSDITDNEMFSSPNQLTFMDASGPLKKVESTSVYVGSPKRVEEAPVVCAALIEEKPKSSKRFSEDNVEVRSRFNGNNGGNNNYNSSHQHNNMHRHYHNQPLYSNPANGNYQDNHSYSNKGGRSGKSMRSLSTTSVVSVESKAYWFLDKFFPISWNFYMSETRADLRQHPLQAGLVFPLQEEFTTMKNSTQFSTKDAESHRRFEFQSDCKVTDLWHRFQSFALILESKRNPLKSSCDAELDVGMSVSDLSASPHSNNSVSLKGCSPKRNEPDKDSESASLFADNLKNSLKHLEESTNLTNDSRLNELNMLKTSPATAITTEGLPHCSEDTRLPTVVECPTQSSQENFSRSQSNEISTFDNIVTTNANTMSNNSSNEKLDRLQEVAEVNTDSEELINQIESSEVPDCTSNTEVNFEQETKPDVLQPSPSSSSVPSSSVPPPPPCETQKLSAKNTASEFLNQNNNVLNRKRDKKKEKKKPQSSLAVNTSNNNNNNVNNKSPVTSTVSVGKGSEGATQSLSSSASSTSTKEHSELFESQLTEEKMELEKMVRKLSSRLVAQCRRDWVLATFGAFVCLLLISRVQVLSGAIVRLPIRSFSMLNFYDKNVPSPSSSNSIRHISVNEDADSIKKALEGIDEVDVSFKSHDSASARTVHWVSRGTTITIGEFSESMFPTEEKVCDDSLGSTKSCRAPHLVEPVGTSYPPQQQVYRYQWLKNGKNITRADYFFPLFTITNSRRSDSGHYVCVRRHVNGNKDDSRVVVNTYVKIAESPLSRTKPRYIELTEGSTLFFQLSNTGSPPPTHQWFKNGVLIPEQTRDALIIPDSNQTHTGTYTCELSNVAGGYTWAEVSVMIKKP